VVEEQQHAALLLRLLGIRAAAQAHGAADRLMVLTVAEVVALSYYGGLAASGPDAVVRAMAARIVAEGARLHPRCPCRLREARRNGAALLVS
jgi:hypothetical protein